MEKKIVRVRDVMKQHVDIVDGKMTVMEALEKMKHVETKSLIIEKRNEDDEYGMVLLSSGQGLGAGTRIEAVGSVRCIARWA